MARNEGAKKQQRQKTRSERTDLVNGVFWGAFTSSACLFPCSCSSA